MNLSFFFLWKHCTLGFPTSPLPSSPSSLSGTITPSVVAVKREQMLELLPTQCTKPPTAGLWTLSLLLHSHKEYSAVTPAPAQASASHLQQDRVDRFTFTFYRGGKTSSDTKKSGCSDITVHQIITDRNKSILVELHPQNCKLDGIIFETHK